MFRGLKEFFGIKDRTPSNKVESEYGVTEDDELDVVICDRCECEVDIDYVDEDGVCEECHDATDLDFLVFNQTVYDNY